MIGRIGSDRLGEIRSKQTPTGGENDHAAGCLLLLGVPPEQLKDPGDGTGTGPATADGNQNPQAGSDSL